MGSGRKVVEGNVGTGEGGVGEGGGVDAEVGGGVDLHGSNQLNK